jgi:SAM-dependent methyltransferase
MSYARKIKHVLAQEGASGLYRRVRGKLKWYLKGKRYSLREVYDDQFFENNLFDSRPMAEWLAPRIAKALGVRTVIDLGCATGHWIAALLKAGVDANGIEGSPWAKERLVCPPERVVIADLRRPVAMPKDNVDLVITIEVAEHIEPQDADAFVANIVRSHPKHILMTAAIPGQGGHGHVNEQPASYWIEKMGNHGYQVDEPTKNLIVKFCDEGRAQKEVPEALRRRGAQPDGVWIPSWMPKNLLVFKKG